MGKVFLILSFFIVNLLLAQNENVLDKVDFYGYIQIRGTSNFGDNSSFLMRRFKIGLKSKPDFSKHWSYKVQTTISSIQEESFFLQDVKIRYKNRLFSFDIGQFVPQYSLQRFQPDYEMAVIERAKVINTLIPDGTLGVRDIGLQANFTTKNNFLHTHLGVFNGYGIDNYKTNNKGYMITNKSEVIIPLKYNKLKLGYSLQYRKADNLILPHILPDTIAYTGDDFRYNLFMQFKNRNLELQAEFLNADLNGEIASGYYVLFVFNLNKNQVALSYEKYDDLIEKTINNPYYRVGYNYLIDSNKIKISLDNYFQIIDKYFENFYTSIQIQLLIN